MLATASFIMPDGGENLVPAHFTLADLLVAVLGASGWGAAAMKMIIDMREERRKTREEKRKDAAEARASYEERAKRAEGMAPFILKLNSGEWLRLYERIDRLSKNPQQKVQAEECNELRGYPAELEEIGALMLAGKFTPDYVFDHFGQEILATKNARQLWEHEDLRYWKIFMLLAAAMEQRANLPQTET